MNIIIIIIIIIIIHFSYFISYINKIQRDATARRCLFTANITLHVSGVYRTHHQEYIKL